MLNVASLVLGICAWVVVVIEIAKCAYSPKSTIISFTLCASSLIVELFEISRRVNIGDYAAIEDTIRAVIIATVVLVAVTIVLNIATLVKAKKPIKYLIE